MILRRSVKGPFFFVHLQKTAGTSLSSQMRERFGHQAVYPDDSDRGGSSRGDAATVLSVSHLQERWDSRRNEIRVVTGHFPLCTTDVLDGDFRTFTLLREPVARTLSYLRHAREVSPELEGHSIEAIYDDPVRFEGLVHNHMVKMFALTASEMIDEAALTPVVFTDDRLARAKAQLETVDVVGLQSDYGQFCRSLERSFGWKLGAPRHMNRTTPVPADPALERRIAADNAMDIEFYEFANNLVAQRMSGPRR